MNSESTAPVRGETGKRLPFLLPLCMIVLIIPLLWCFPSALFSVCAALVVGSAFALLCLYELNPVFTVLPVLFFPIFAGIRFASGPQALMTLALFLPAIPEVLTRKTKFRYKDALIAVSAVLFALFCAAGLLGLKGSGAPISPEGFREALEPILSSVRTYVSSFEGELLGEKVALFSDDEIESILNLLIGLLPGLLGAASLTLAAAGSYFFRVFEQILGYSDKRPDRSLRMSLASSLVFSVCALLFFAADRYTSSTVELLSGNLLLILLPGTFLCGFRSFFRRLFRSPSLLSLLLMVLFPLFFLRSPFTALFFCAVYGAVASIIRHVRLAIRVLLFRGRGDDEDE